LHVFEPIDGRRWRVSMVCVCVCVSIGVQQCAAAYCSVVCHMSTAERVCVCALVCCSVQQRVAVWCAPCQRQSVSIGVLQCAAACCSEVLHLSTAEDRARVYGMRVCVCTRTHQCFAVCSNVLQCIEACCSVLSLLRCVATVSVCCNTSQLHKMARIYGMCECVGVRVRVLAFV